MIGRAFVSRSADIKKEGSQALPLIDAFPLTEGLVHDSAESPEVL